MTADSLRTQFFEEGAGKGPGLNGPGSQWAVDQASTSEGPSAGSSTSGGSGGSGPSTSSNAAVRGPVPAMSNAPIVVSGLVVLFTLVGAVAL
jgi:hypothetical protein